MTASAVRPQSARRLPLLLLAILVPSAAVLLLGFKTVAQERELADKRHADARHRQAADIRQTLLARLERARLAALGGLADSAIVLTAALDSNGVVLPWLEDSAARRFEQQRNELPYAALLADAERAEHQMHDSVAAETLFARARRATRDDALAAHAELEALHVARRSPKRIDRLLRLTQLSFDARDEYGVPFALYAARGLQTEGSFSRPVDSDLTDRIERQLLESPTLSPTACHLAYELVSSDRSRPNLTRAKERCRELDAADESAPALSTLATAGSAQSSAPPWQWWSSSGWFVTVTHTRDHRVIVAVRGKTVLGDTAVAHSAIHLVASSVDGEPIGPPFVDTFVDLANVKDSGDTASLQGWFYAAGLALVVVLAGVAAYLLWRDVRRRSELTAIRAEFVSSVSHELKTPLTAIRMYADTMLMHEQLDPATRGEYLSTIVGESERLTRLLNNVLDFARIERGKKLYEMRAIDLAGVVGSAARTMEYPLTQQGYRLAVHVPPAGVRAVVRADADSIEQAILNLLVNAMKYSGDSRDIALTLSVSSDEAIIAVTDHGIGIPSAEQERIFEQFYRVASTTGSSQPGAGLGLSIVRHAVQAHGGRIVIHSAPGDGSTFSIHVPLARSEAAAVAAKGDEATVMT